MKRILVGVCVVALLLSVILVFAQEHGEHAGRGGEHGQRLSAMMEQWDTNEDGQLTKEEFKGPDEMFERLDADGDGVITKAEVEAVRAQRGQRGGDPAQRWQHMLERVDANNDGQISKDEFQGEDEVFDRLDGNGDGTLSQEEFVAATRRRGQGGGDPGQWWQRMLERADANKDGKLSKEEFQGPDEMFDRFDADGDGILTQEEFTAAAGQQRQRQRQAPGIMLMRMMDKDGDERISQIEWMGLFAEADADADGFVTLAELDAHMRKMAAPPQGRGPGAQQEAPE